MIVAAYVGCQLTRLGWGHNGALLSPTCLPSSYMYYSYTYCSHSSSIAHSPLVAHNYIICSYLLYLYNTDRLYLYRHRVSQSSFVAVKCIYYYINISSCFYLSSVDSPSPALQATLTYWCRGACYKLTLVIQLPDWWPVNNYGCGLNTSFCGYPGTYQWPHVTLPGGGTKQDRREPNEKRNWERVTLKDRAVASSLASQAMAGPLFRRKLLYAHTNNIIGVTLACHPST